MYVAEYIICVFNQFDVDFLHIIIHNTLSLVQGSAAHTKQQFVVYTFK